MKYTRAGQEYGGDDIPRGGVTKDRPDGGNLDSYTTTEEPGDTILYRDLLSLAREAYRYPPMPKVFITCEGWWTGYSEYTITDSWSTVTISIPGWGWERTWESVADLYSDLAKVAS